MVSVDCHGEEGMKRNTNSFVTNPYVFLKGNPDSPYQNPIYQEGKMLYSRGNKQKATGKMMRSNCRARRQQQRGEINAASKFGRAI